MWRRWARHRMNVVRGLLVGRNDSGFTGHVDAAGLRGSKGNEVDPQGWVNALLFFAKLSWSCFMHFCVLKRRCLCRAHRRSDGFTNER